MRSNGRPGRRGLRHGVALTLLCGLLACGNDEPSTGAEDSGSGGVSDAAAAGDGSDLLDSTASDALLTDGAQTNAGATDGASTDTGSGDGGAADGATADSTGQDVIIGPACTSPGVLGANRLRVGYNHTCAMKKDGSVWCWGENGDGELGNGEFGVAARKLVPNLVPASKAP